MGFGYQFQSLGNEALVNNVIGKMAVTFQSDSVTAGVRNLGLSFGVSVASAGVYTVAWPTSTISNVRGGVAFTETYGQFGSDSARPPFIEVQAGSIGVSIDVLARVVGVASNAATLSLVGISHNATTMSVASAGVFTASAGRATIFVHPCTMSALNAQSFSFATS